MTASADPWPFHNPLAILQRRMNQAWHPASAWATTQEALDHALHHNLGEQNLDWRVVTIPAAGTLRNLIEGQIV
jgi:hypothetical protein